ncbi:protein canopy 4-like [Physella acuta]|uniref:protein canopy 4-like n=1 Tax=Physella acuta TaxID=109671 RepID=UPI0027DB8450|nr:protein canopy 4-like [Physella acuta]XP_059163866.1 protein canopy 4-like [Physella acuta]
MFKEYNAIVALPIILLFLYGTPRCCHGTEANEPESHEDPHRNPSLCEVCKYLATELRGRLDETGKTNEVIETGYGLDVKKKKKQYRKSELRLIEAVNDPHVCEKILEYNVHAERKGSLRFAKGRSQTMTALHNLKDKGVKVELGIPYELWDTPSAGVTEMQRKCFQIVEDFEETIEDWYWNHQDKDLTKFLCKDKVLKKDDLECLKEEWKGEVKKKTKPKDKNKQKGDVGEQPMADSGEHQVSETGEQQMSETNEQQISETNEQHIPETGERKMPTVEKTEL